MNIIKRQNLNKRIQILTRVQESHLRKRKNIVITSADEGGADVLIKRKGYIKEAERQLR